MLLCRAATLSRSQRPLGRLLQFAHKIMGPQRATSMSRLPHSHNLRLAFPSLKILPPARNAPPLLPFPHRHPVLRRSGSAVSRGARPGPGFSFHNQPRPHRIQLRIAQRLPQVRLVQRARIISSLPHMPARIVLPIPVSCVSTVGMLERFRESVGAARNHHQMNMVRHRAVADQRGLMLFDVFPQQVKIYFPIRVAV